MQPQGTPSSRRRASDLSNGPVADLAQVGRISMDNITRALSAASASGQRYAWVGSNAMVAVSTSQEFAAAAAAAKSDTDADDNSSDGTPSNAGNKEDSGDTTASRDPVQAFWLRRYKSTDGSEWPRQASQNGSASTTPSTKNPPPHLYELANSTYFQLRRTGINQSIVFTGASGSGKTTQLDLILGYFFALSAPTKSPENINRIARMRAARTVLDAFCSTRSPNSLNASRFGATYELQFNQKCRISGLKIAFYAFEASRAAGPRSSSRSMTFNFNAFYYLLAGIPDELRAQLYLPASGPFASMGELPHDADEARLDASRFTQWTRAMHKVGLNRRLQVYILTTLAALMHLSNVEFSSSGAGCTVSNPEAVASVATMLEVDADALEGALTTRTTSSGRDVTSAILSATEAAASRDSLISSLYHLIVVWLIWHINTKLASPTQPANTLLLVDFPSGSVSSGKTSSQNLKFAYLNERLNALVFYRLFNYGAEDLRQEGFQVQDFPLDLQSSATVEYHKRPQLAEVLIPADFMHLFCKVNGGTASRFLETVFAEASAQTELAYTNANIQVPSLSPASPHPIVFSNAFSVPTYPQTASRVVPGSLISDLDNLVTALQVTNTKAVVCVSPNPDPHSTLFNNAIVRSQLQKMLVVELASHLSAQNGANYTFRFRVLDFALKYGRLFGIDTASITSDAEVSSSNSSKTTATSVSCRIKDKLGFPETDLFIGPTTVVMRDEVFRFFETKLRRLEQEDMFRAKNGLPPRKLNEAEMALPDGADSDDDAAKQDQQGLRRTRSSPDPTPDDPLGLGRRTSSMRRRNMSDDSLTLQSLPESAYSRDDEEITQKKEKRSGARVCWLSMVWALTWWIPGPSLWCCCRMKEPDRQIAWREKVAIFLLIMLCCGLQIFLVIIFGKLVCPLQNIYTLDEMFYKASADFPIVSVYGNIYDLRSFYKRAYHVPATLGQFIGLDITAGFPRTPAYYCDYAKSNAENAPPFFSPQTASSNGTYIQLVHRPMYERDNFGAQMLIDSAFRASVIKSVGWSLDTISQVSSGNTSFANKWGRQRKMFAVNGKIYDVQPYVDSLQDAKSDFLPSGLLDYINSNAGKDFTNDQAFMKAWNADSALRACMANLMGAGIVDYRKSARCVFSNYVLVAFSALLVAVTVSKFIAALRVGAPSIPEALNKFVLILVPCYSESEESLRQTIKSLAALDYDDKRKLLVIICDGNVMGSGNDRPTPRIVLDILGVPESVDPDPAICESVATGGPRDIMRLNRGKVYSGLYEVEGRQVPYIVISKVGAKHERVKPGNRGKRDSQMILMRFLSRYHFNQPMSPLELEIAHHIKNVIGVNPAFYEFCMMVDADTVVDEHALTRLVAIMIQDASISAACGETKLSNEHESWATMIQVYEYYISHHLAKAFESLFGSVTCLPGCFCMYRVHTETGKSAAVLAHPALISAYGTSKVTTLHEKNLLMLGEDRYLTTLILKTFPRMRTVFTAQAQCNTTAPETWSILLSQRRRWINSTVHNLVELLNVPGLCGFCCFSMRFIVFLDLIATIVQPAVVVYLGYLVYLVINMIITKDTNSLPMVSIILLAVIYGLQALVFLIKREWQHVGWMLVYILAIPLFSFVIPLYSFWRMDDFSWGSTRKIEKSTERGRSRRVDENAEFHDSLIPKQKWSDHEKKMWEQHADSLQVITGRRASMFAKLDHLDQPIVKREPNNTEIKEAVKKILGKADLMTVTRRKVREELAQQFGFDLSAKREYIHQCITEVSAELLEK